MRTDQPPAPPQPVRLSDYRAPDFLIPQIELDIALAPEDTVVRARLTLTRNGDHDRPLVLNGEGLTLVSIALDGRPLAPGAYRHEDDALTLAGVPDSFVLETQVQIAPAANTALMGLYMSGGRFCTQCEAEGFRRITFHLDRPDVLSRYRVRLEAERQAYPHLLSNGNRIEAGALDAGRHFAVWEDPFPKPSYLFALVAGELDVLDDSFVTASGRTVALRIFVDPGQAARATFAMDALKRSMAWDEAVYGREYDLDLFMIVAVRDFNFGAMENKGLNIFNSSLLLADADTATDADYERIESVVAHEYFHNWSGNRVTCRDWFQLCVKEGLTVFRDQGFSADQRGHAVQRIKDVRMLRARQYPEDSGPMAHAARPETYLKIDNFYTATVYEKGAEIVRLLATLLGPQDFRRGMDRYFETFDGQAITVEDFVGAFEQVTGRDLSGLFRWYAQAGRPVLSLTPHWDAQAGTLELELAQATAPTPGQAEKSPVPIPVRLGLLDPAGRALSFADPDGWQGTETVLLLDGPRARFRLTGLPPGQPPVISPLRGLSAPVDLDFDQSREDRFIRMAAEPDLFSRWEAGQDLARELILARAAGKADAEGEAAYARAVAATLDEVEAPPAFKALMLVPPSETDLAQAVTPIDPSALAQARQSLRQGLARHLRERLQDWHSRLTDGGAAFSPEPEAAGRRALRNAALESLAAHSDQAAVAALAQRHVEAATNMTERLGGLAALSEIGGEAFDQTLAQFHARWRHEPLILDKWFAIQARTPGEATVDRVIALTRHPDFEPRNPNRLRALIATFSQANPAAFHRADGAGHALLADVILATDGFNPMVAARMIEPLAGWRRYRSDLAASMRSQLERIFSAPGLSKNVLELAGKALGS